VPTAQQVVARYFHPRAIGCGLSFSTDKDILSGAICLPHKIKKFVCFNSCPTGGLSVSTEGVCRFRQEIVE